MEHARVNGNVHHRTSHTMMMMQVVVVVVAENASNFVLGPTGAQTEWDGQVMSG